MEASNRFAVEAKLQKALAVVWAEWSKERDPSKLTKAYLEELLANECEGPLWAVWLSANTNVLLDYGQEQDEAALAAAFLLFFSNWRKNLAERWGARVDEYVDSNSVYISGGGGGGSGGTSGRKRTMTHFATVGEQIDFQPEDGKVSDNKTVGRGAEPEPEAVDEPEEPLPWSEAKDEILTESDFTREAVTTVTETHTDGEVAAAAKVQRAGTMLIAIWRVEPGACEFCEKLDGTRPNVWRVKVPNGPPAHNHCRCWLEWVAIEST